MHNLVRKLAVLFGFSACAIGVMNAQETKAATSNATPPNFKQVFLYQLGDTEKKLVGLAEAMPAEKFGWRPAEGVRSVSEVFMHEAGANIFFLTFMGVKPPAGFDEKGEKTITEKPKVIQAMKDSFGHVRQAVTPMTADDLMKATKFIGGGMQSYQTVLFFMAGHMREHLGQSIAYARMNNITPPWSKGGTE